MPDRSLCVQCRQHPAEPRWRPFCSERCRMVDLGRWLSGDYRVAGHGLGDTESGPERMDPDQPDARLR